VSNGKSALTQLVSGESPGKSAKGKDEHGNGQGNGQSNGQSNGESNDQSTAQSNGESNDQSNDQSNVQSNGPSKGQSKGSSADQYEHKVLICHIPPGNPANAHTISVDQSAVPAHLAHGDTLGPCP
jgi:hypothetical protein